VLKRLLLLLSLAGGTPLLHAQASATASRAGDILVGGGYSTAASDYGVRFNGFNIYGDFDFLSHFGVEAKFNYVKAPSPSILSEKTYEIGARYFRTYRRLVPYGKIMVGRGVFNYPACFGPPADQNVACANLAYNEVSAGIGTDVKVRPWLYVRADYEFQHWFSFRGTPTSTPDSLAPKVFSIGAAYHFR
jgi:opacity protein-like surface antigen